MCKISYLSVELFKLKYIYHEFLNMHLRLPLDNKSNRHTLSVTLCNFHLLNTQTAGHYELLLGVLFTSIYEHEPSHLIHILFCQWVNILS